MFRALANCTPMNYRGHVAAVAIFRAIAGEVFPGIPELATIHG